MLVENRCFVRFRGKIPGETFEWTLVTHHFFYRKSGLPLTTTPLCNPSALKMVAILKGLRGSFSIVSLNFRAHERLPGNTFTTYRIIPTLVLCDVKHAAISVQTGLAGSYYWQYTPRKLSLPHGEHVTVYTATCEGPVWRQLSAPEAGRQAD